MAQGSAALQFAKGAADALVERCVSAWPGGRAVPLDAVARGRMHTQIEQLTASGRRVLAVAAHPLAAMRTVDVFARVSPEHSFV